MITRTIARLDLGYSVVKAVSAPMPTAQKASERGSAGAPRGHSGKLTRRCLLNVIPELSAAEKNGTTKRAALADSAAASYMRCRPACAHTALRSPSGC